MNNLPPHVIDAVRNGEPITVLGRVYAPAEEIERLRAVEAEAKTALAASAAALRALADEVERLRAVEARARELAEARGEAPASRIGARWILDGEGRPK